MNKCTLFPFELESIPLVLHSDLTKYKLNNISSPRSWGFCDKDAGDLIGMKLGYHVIADFQEAIKDSDAVIFPKAILKLDERTQLKLFSAAITQNKGIILLTNISEELYNTLEKLCDLYGVSLTSPVQGIAAKAPGLPVNYRMIEPPAPVITFAGLFDCPSILLGQLSLYKNLLSNGYKVLCVTNNNYGEFFGVHSYPDFMFDFNIDVEDRITLFNHYINLLCESENPDIILIATPGGLFPINDKHYQNFGFQNYMFSNAIQTDYGILCASIDNNTTKQIEYLQSRINEKFDFSTNCILLSYKCIDWTLSSVRVTAFTDIRYLSLSEPFLTEQAEDYRRRGFFACNAFNQRHMRELTSNIICTLTSDEFKII